jgi:ABC-2 type transport system permease protein
VLGALLYLQLTSWRGMLRSRLLRLKQPKYLVGALVGVAYVYFIFLRRGGPRGGGYPQSSSIPAEGLPIITTVAALALLIVVALSWMLPRRSAGLTFSEAEIAFLFPAPIRRRTLIHFRLITAQIGLVLTSLILALVSNRWTFLGGNALTHAIGWWLVLATLNLHFTGSAFVITRLRNRGVTSLRRQLIAVGIAVLAVVATVAWVVMELRLPSAADLASAETLKTYAVGMLASGPLPWLLAIPKLVVAPFLAADVPAFAFALLPALAVLVLHYFWVMRSEVAFEEVAVARAEKRAARIAAIREGRSHSAAGGIKSQRAPFRLKSSGAPEIAFLWKNLIATHGFFRPRTFLIAAAIITGGCGWLGRHPEFGGLFAAVWAVATAAVIFTLLLGPQVTRNDLRGDLLNSDILKTYPLHGWQIVLGELLAPIAILTSLLWLELLALTLSVPADTLQSIGTDLRIAIVASLAVVAVPFCALQLLVPNTVAVLFPAWVRTVSNRSEHGLDIMGQRIIFIAGQALVALIALLPAGIVASILYFLAQWLVGPPIAVLIAAAAVFGILTAEVWAGVRWLGGRFDAFDLSSELRP